MSKKIASRSCTCPAGEATGNLVCVGEPGRSLRFQIQLLVRVCSAGKQWNPPFVVSDYYFVFSQYQSKLGLPLGVMYFHSE